MTSKSIFRNADRRPETVPEHELLLHAGMHTSGVGWLDGQKKRPFPVSIHDHVCVIMIGMIIACFQLFQGIVILNPSVLVLISQTISLNP